MDALAPGIVGKGSGSVSAAVVLAPTLPSRNRIVAAADITALTVRGFPATTQDILRVEDSAGSAILRVSGATAATSMSSLDVGADGYFRSGDADDVVTVGYVVLSSGGIKVGTDCVLYRAAANAWRTQDMMLCEGGISTFTKAGIPADTDFALPLSGQIAVDTTNSRLYVRVGATWKYAALT